MVNFRVAVALLGLSMLYAVMRQQEVICIPCAHCHLQDLPCQVKSEPLQSGIWELSSGPHSQQRHWHEVPVMEINDAICEDLSMISMSLYFNIIKTLEAQ